LLRVVASGLVEEIEGSTETASLSLVSIDVETTGRDPAADRIVEIACVIWRNGALEARHSWLVNPGRPISEEASGVHGIRDEDVQDKPSFDAIAPELLALLQGLLPMAYNAEFDRNFLISELARAGVPLENPPPAVRKGIEWVDPLVWARELQKDEKGKSLGEVAQRLGIEIARAHRATDDAEAALHVMQRFLNDARVPRNYAAFVQEQKRLSRIFTEERQHWRSAPVAVAR
jgi:DNA polymerase-3 subunit epsilon